MTNTRTSVRSALTGTWKLESWQIIGPDGEVEHPLGVAPLGQLMYDDRSSTVSAQLVQGSQPSFASDDWQEATPEERAAAWPRYFGYFGTFSIDEMEATVTHHVESGWFPNLVGTDQVRHYRLEAGRLILDADTAWGAVQIVWSRQST